jgi:hypothetical protein
VPKLKHGASIFGDKLKSFLYSKQENVTFDLFCKRSRRLFLISYNEATKLSKYCFNLGSEIEQVDPLTLGKVDLIQSNLARIIGKYSPFSDNVIDSIVHEFISYFKSSKITPLTISGDDLHKNEFIKSLRNLSKCDIINPMDIQNLVSFSEMNISSQPIIAFLCRQSMSMYNITKDSLELLITKLLSPHKKFESLNKLPKRQYSYNQRLSLNFKENLIFKESDMSSEEILTRGQKLFVSFADFFYEHNMTLNDIIYTHIFYKVIDGFEYQMISLDHLYECIENVGFVLKKYDRICIQNFSEIVFKNTVKVRIQSLQ